MGCFSIVLGIMVGIFVDGISGSGGLGFFAAICTMALSGFLSSAIENSVRKQKQRSKVDASYRETASPRTGQSRDSAGRGRSSDKDPRDFQTGKHNVYNEVEDELADLKRRTDKAYADAMAKAKTSGRGTAGTSTGTKDSASASEAAKRAAESKRPREPQKPKTPRQKHIQMLEDCRVNAPNEYVYERVGDLIALVGKIYDRMEERPEQAPMASKYLEQYIPIITRAVKTDTDLIAKGISSTELDGLHEDLIESLDTSVIAFDNILDRMYKDEVMDVSTDLTAMSGMLKSEGLLDDGLDSPDDTFVIHHEDAAPADVKRSVSQPEQKLKPSEDARHRVRKAPTGRYMLDGFEYTKKQIPLAIVKRYMLFRPETTAEELMQIFDRDLQGSYGVVRTYRDLVDKYNDSKDEFYTDPKDLIRTSTEVCVVCNQWGTANVKNIVDRANELGMDVTEVEERQIDIGRRSEKTPAEVMGEVAEDFAERAVEPDPDDAE